MKSHTQLESVVFQLTPTRTRYDLVIVANGKTEKLSSGLLEPFLAHLRTAKDQVTKGGYSIRLEPKSGANTVWFTKGIVERFIRYVSSPDVIERVNTLESEVLQINEAIVIQGNDSLGFSSVEDYRRRWNGLSEGSRSAYDGYKEKAISLLKNGSLKRLSLGSTMLENNSRLQLLRVLETRKSMLLKEQGMAFARAVAAGFDIDHLANLELFSKHFGASRLLEACIRFMELWNVKHNTGELLEVIGPVALPFLSEVSPVKFSGAILPKDISEQKEFTKSHPVSDYTFSTEIKGNTDNSTVDLSSHQSISDRNEDKIWTPDPQVPGAEQIQNPMFLQWASRSHPGPPVSQFYSAQGMPYYQNYPGSASPFHLPYPPVENQGFSITQSGVDQTVSVIEKGVSQGREFDKKAHLSGKRRSSLVVKRSGHDKSASESQSSSDADADTDTEEVPDLQVDAPEIKHKSSRSLKKNEPPARTMKSSNIDEKNQGAHGQEEDGGNWQTFQNLLLRVQKEITSTVNRDICASEKTDLVKKRPNGNQVDPIVNDGRKIGDAQILLQGNRQSVENEGGGSGYLRMCKDSFMIHRPTKQNMSTRVCLDSVTGNEYENTSYLNRKSLRDVTDESFIVPFRSELHDECGTDKRSIIDLNSDFPLALQKSKECSTRTKNERIYEPNDSSMFPKRGLEKGSTSVDPSKELNMQTPRRIRNAVKTDTRSQQVKMSQEGLKTLETEKSSATKYALDKRKMDAISRSGKSSKLNPLAEAKARAEKLRAYKADLQRAKKEKEDEDMKRLEALKRERQRRIAARSSNIAQPPLNAQQTKTRNQTRVSPSSYTSSKFNNTTTTISVPNITPSSSNLQQTRTHRKTSLSPIPYTKSKFTDAVPASSLPVQKVRGSSKIAGSTSNSQSQESTARKLTRLSPCSYKGSSFNDTAPSFSSPLQSFPSRTSPVSSSRSHKPTTAIRLNLGTHSKFTDTEYSSSAPIQKLSSRTTSGRFSDSDKTTSLVSKAKIASSQTKRISDPKGSNTHHVSSVRPVSSNQVSKAKMTSASLAVNKIASASLQENTMRASRRPAEVQKNQVSKAGSRTLTSENLRGKKGNIEDDPIVEKAVVMLEDKPISSSVCI